MLMLNTKHYMKYLEMAKWKKKFKGEFPFKKKRHKGISNYYYYYDQMLKLTLFWNLAFTK